LPGRRIPPETGINGASPPLKGVLRRRTLAITIAATTVITPAAATTTGGEQEQFIAGDSRRGAVMGACRLAAYTIAAHTGDDGHAKSAAAASIVEARTPVAINFSVIR
jgi:hypothetical protein